MKRRYIAFALAALLALVPATALAAVDVVSPIFYELGPVLAVDGSLTGTDPALSYQVSVTGVALVQTTCAQNGNSGRTEPGDTISLQSSGYQVLEPGDTTFVVVTDPLTAPTPEQAGCKPNAKEVRLGAVDWGGAAITVSQGATFVATEGFVIP